MVLTADDFSVRGGAADAAIHRKLVEAEKLASEYRLPLIRLIEGTGGGGSVKTLEDTGYTYVPVTPSWPANRGTPRSPGTPIASTTMCCG